MSDRLEAAPRSKVPAEEWDAFADASDDAWLWHRWHLCEALTTWPGVSDLSFALRSPAGKLVAILPLRRTSFTRARRVAFTRLDSLGGPAVANDAVGKARDRLRGRLIDELDELRDRDVETQVALAPMTPALRGEQLPKVSPLLALGFDDVSSQTWVIDLSRGHDAVWAGLKKGARQSVRKAEQAGVTVRTADRPADRDAYYGLHVETYRRTGAEPHPRAYFEAIWSGLAERGVAELMVAELDGEVLAGSNFGLYKGAAIYWTGASAGRALDVGANHLLQWRAIESMIDRGMDSFESGEAFPAARGGKAEGLSYFKASFGGELQPYFRGRIGTPSRMFLAVDALDAIRRAIAR